MKILHINNFFNPGGSAAACYFAAKGLKNLLENSIEQEFIGCVDGKFRYKMGELGLTFLCPYKPNFSYDTDLIERHIKSFNPDIIHVWLPGKENPQYFEYLKKIQTKKLITVLCCQPIGFDSSIFNHVCFLSNYNKNLSTNIATNVSVIRGGVDEPALYYNQEHASDNEYNVFGRIAAFCPSKKIEDTVECAKCLPNNKFIIAGEVLDNNYATHIKNIAPANVILYFNISELTKAQILSSVNIIHYPTTNESFCYSIVESLSYNKPVISYDNSAIPEITDHKVANSPLILVSSLQDLIIKTAAFSLKEYSPKISNPAAVYYKEYTTKKYSTNIRNLYV